MRHHTSPTAFFTFAVTTFHHVSTQMGRHVLTQTGRNVSPHFTTNVAERFDWSHPIHVSTQVDPGRPTRGQQYRHGGEHSDGGGWTRRGVAGTFGAPVTLATVGVLTVSAVGGATFSGLVTVARTELQAGQYCLGSSPSRYYWMKFFGTCLHEKMR